MGGSINSKKTLPQRREAAKCLLLFVFFVPLCLRGEKNLIFGTVLIIEK